MKKAIKIIAAFIVVCGINFHLFPFADKLTWVYGVNIFGINSFLNILLFYMVWKAIRNLPEINKRAKKFIIFLASFFAITQTIGSLLIKKNSLELVGWEYLSCPIILIGFAILFYVLFAHIVNWTDNFKVSEKEQKEWSFFTNNAKSFWLVSLVLVLCYAPFFISFWPGLAGYDLNSGTVPQMGQIKSGNYSAFHPLIHTFFIRIFYEISVHLRFNFLPFYEITQIIICCLTFSYLLYFLAKIKVSRFMRIIVFIFFAFNPFMHIFAASPTKDVMFCLICIFLFIEFYKMSVDFQGYASKIVNVVKIVLLLFLFTITRNNAWFAFLFAIPFLVLAFRQHWIKISVILISVIILFQAFNFYQYNILKAGGTEIREAISPILQQMRKVYFEKEKELDAEEIEILGEIIDLSEKKFEDTSNDVSKKPDVFNQEVFNQDRAKYISLWARLGMKYPLVYLSTFLNVNLSYWYLDAPTPRNNFGAGGYLIVQPDSRGDPWSFFDNTDISQMPLSAVGKAYMHLNRNIIASNIPIISFLTSHAFHIMTMLVIMLLLIYRKSKTYIVFVPFIAYGLTLLLGPLADARYAMSLIILAIPSIAIFTKQLGYSKGE